MEKTNSILKPRNPNAFKKLERLNKAINHHEPDRIPIGEFFWGSFIDRWRADLHLEKEANPYYYYDLDWIVTVPNLDPWVRDFEILSQDSNEVLFKTGFGAIVRKKIIFPMPELMSWEMDSIEKLEVASFDEPNLGKRFFEGGDNHIAGAGDTFSRNSPPWLETVKNLRPDFPVYGSVIECSECLTRLVGQENAMLWMGLYPERMGKCINRIGAYYLELARAQIKAADGQIDGMVIWGDVAYRNGMFFNPEYWRIYFKPWVEAIIRECHANKLPVIYHGCGNVLQIIPDFVEIGLDVYNPLERKAGMDVVELKKQYRNRMAYCGNNNIITWESGNLETIKKEILTNLNAAKGGGYIFQSDHSVSCSVSGKTYDYIINLVRKYGQYPLYLEEYDINLSGE